MSRKMLRICLRHYRYAIGVILITIVLFSYVKNIGDLHRSLELKTCKKLLLNRVSDKAKKYIYFNKEKRPGTLDTKKLRRWIQRQNAQGKVLNMDLYGPLTTNTIIFVVQVHRYSCNIKYLLASLSEVEGIQDTLIIFSHSYVDHNLYCYLQRIEFCRILQIFYPYSIQAIPKKFPGYDKYDCPTNADMKTAIKLNCTNAMTPDIHGRYRDPINAEMKHHWWWSANKVFEDLSYTTKHKGIVVFLETNLYIYKNFFYIAKMMKSISKTLHHCDFLSLGSMKDMKGKNMFDLEFTTWNPKYHSDILAIDVNAWKTIKSHYKIFCYTDDYSWARSIFDISINSRSGKVFKVLSSATAKALQTCSSIEDVMDCDVVDDVVAAINLQEINRELLFPRYLRIFHNIDLYEDEFGIDDYVEISGGWNDQRDKHLCSNMTINKVRRQFVTVDENLNLETYDY